MARILLLFAALLAGSAAGAQTLSFGASIQLTGPVANTGRYYKDAYEFAAERINAAGGVQVGASHLKINLAILDNQSDVNLSVRQYVQLLAQDHVDLLLGPFASNFVLADSSIGEKNRVPMVQGGGASDQIYTRGYKYIFGTLPPASDYFGSTIAAMAGFSPKPRTVALLYADDAFDVSVAEGTRQRLAKAGLSAPIDERYSSNTSDFGSLLARIKSENVDAVLVAGHETEALNFIRQAKSLDASPRMYAFTVGVPSEDFRKALGADGNYAFGMTPWLPDRALADRWFGDAEKFARDYKAKFGYDPDYHAAAGVAALEALVVAIEACGSTDAVKVRDQLARSDFESLYGRIAFSPEGQISLAQTAIQVQNGRLVAVYGPKGRLQDAQYPMPQWSQRK